MAIDLTSGLADRREYVFTKRSDTPEMRDAVNVWLEETRGAFGMRIGVEADMPDWDSHDVWLDIAFPDGRVISLRERGAAHPPVTSDGLARVLGAGPLSFRCVIPFRQWTASFEVSVPQITARDLINDPYTMPANPPIKEVEFEIEMNMAVPLWVPGSLLADAGAVLRSGDEGEFMSPRYEQLFVAKGTLRISDVVDRLTEYDFTARGLRIRRQGVRKFEGFWGHCWQSALFPSGRAFGFITYPPRSDGTPSYNEGYIFDGEGGLKPAGAIQVPWLSKLVESGGDASCVLETSQGSQIGITGETFANTRSRGHRILPPDFPIVQQAHVRYCWGGEETYGMMERSSMPDKVTR